MTTRRLTFNFVVLAFTVFVSANVSVSAQDKAIEHIKRSYEEIGKRIDLSEKGTEDSQYAGIFCNELVINKNKHVWPVVGNYETSYKFYYELAHTEGHPYPDQLRKVVMKSRMSDRSYYSEYLFDEAGSLVFYFAKPNEPAIGNEPQRVEKRIYFAGGRPIRIINGQTVSSSLTKQEIEMAKEVVKNSTQVKLYFAKSMSLPDG